MSSGERCDRPARAKGLCSAHYMQQYREEPIREPRTVRGEGARVTVRMAAEKLALVVEAAKAEGLSVVEWVRDAIDRKLGKP